MEDWLFMLLGFGAMKFSGTLTTTPSVWNPLIDLASFAVSGSLIYSQPKNSWSRRVGMLQFGVHLAQLKISK